MGRGCSGKVPKAALVLWTGRSIPQLRNPFDRILDKLSLSESSQAAAGAASSSSSSNGGSFDCNICLELARDPVVTLCGHLFCWPCLYRWLHLHSSCHECPVCKALVEEEKVVPQYGRGKVGSVDPRTKAVPDEAIPERPSRQRPSTAPPADGQYHQPGFNFMAGAGVPMATAWFGNFTFSAGFGSLPGLFGFQLNDLSSSSAFGPGYSFGGRMAWETAYAQNSQPLTADQQQDATLSKLLLFLGILVVLCVVFF